MATFVTFDLIMFFGLGDSSLRTTTNNNQERIDTERGFYGSVQTLQRDRKIGISFMIQAVGVSGVFFT